MTPADLRQWARVKELAAERGFDIPDHDTYFVLAYRPSGLWLPFDSTEDIERFLLAFDVARAVLAPFSPGPASCCTGPAPQAISRTCL